MLTGTTELAVKALILMGLSQAKDPATPHRLAERLGCSPTYLGKTLGRLVRANILRSVHGARGGVLLARAPRTITLLEIVEACQGAIVGDYCHVVGPGDGVVTCRFHRVMAEVQAQVVDLLSSCTLADLLVCPVPAGRRRKSAGIACRMSFRGIEDLADARRTAARR